MRQWFKENWFKFSVVVLLAVAICVYVVDLTNKSNREAQRVAREQIQQQQALAAQEAYAHEQMTLQAAETARKISLDQKRAACIEVSRDYYNRVHRLITDSYDKCWDIWSSATFESNRVSGQASCKAERDTRLQRLEEENRSNIQACAAQYSVE